MSSPQPTATPPSPTSPVAGPRVPPTPRPKASLRSQACAPCDSPFFNTEGLFAIFEGMAKRLGTKPEFLAALALQESGWELRHVYETHPSSNGRPLNNLFGLTDAGHNNLRFDSIQASAAYWEATWGRALANKPQTMEAFVADLLDRKPPYNSYANYRVALLGGAYPEDDPKNHITAGQHTIGTYRSLLKWLEISGKSLH